MSSQESFPAPSGFYSISDHGLFGPGSMIWKVNSEGVLLAGGGRALILQVAHPLVAQGVADHSRYREDPWGRLWRTLDLTTKLVFGDLETAAKSAAAIRAAHRRVRGTLSEDLGAFPAGTPYDAADPDLLLWVHATLIDTALVVYERLIARLEPDELEAYYEDQKALGLELGIPEGHQPDSYKDFRQYFEEMLASDRIAVGAACRDVAQATLRPDLPFIARPLVEALGIVTSAMLPEKLRGELDLGYGPAHRALFDGSNIALSGVLRLTPSFLRQFPIARAATRS